MKIPGEIAKLLLLQLQQRLTPVKIHARVRYLTRRGPRFQSTRPDLHPSGRTAPHPLA